MSDVSGSLDALPESHYFRPEELYENPRYNVRPWSSNTQAEDKEIDGLAERIELLGQQDPVRIVFERPPKSIRPVRGGEAPATTVQSNGELPFIYAGTRRRRAIQLINTRRSAKSNGTAELLRVWCVVDRSGGDPRQKAFSSNRDRKNMLPMDIAELILGLRKEFGQEASGTAKISKYLGVSKALITQHERLLKSECTNELRDRMQDGAITMDTALEIMVSKIDPAKHEEVIKVGKQIQDREAVDKISDDKSRASREVRQQRVDKALARTRVELPAIKKAIRELQPEARVKPGKKEDREFWESLDGSAYGHPNGAVRQFVRYYIDEWWEGDGTEKMLLAKFDSMVKGADGGDKQGEQGAEVNVTTTDTTITNSTTTAAITKENSQHSTSQPTDAPKKSKTRKNIASKSKGKK